MNIFLSIIFNICVWCSKEPSHCDGSFEYLQHMFWLRNKNIYVTMKMRHVIFMVCVRAMSSSGTIG